MTRRTVLLGLILLGAALAGCIGDDQPADPAQADPDSVPDEAPTYDLPAQIAGMEAESAIEHGSAAGLVIHEDLAYVAGLGNGFYIADVSDPKNPEKLGELENATSRDVDTFTVDGHLHVALGDDSNGIHIANVSDPTDPELLVEGYDIGASVHNLNILDGTTILYNSRSLGSATNPGIDIVDLSDPENPDVTVWEFPAATIAGPAGTSPTVTTGCHDIETDTEVDRAYCAGVTQTYILDISDPFEPQVLSTINNPSVNIHHWAIPDADHEVLIIGDEFGGAQAPSTCLANARSSAAEASQPYGGLWFYDISDPENPIPQGWISAPTYATDQVCTAHFGQLIPDRDQVAVGWYTAGVLLVDFEDPTQPTLVDQWGEDETNVWDVQYHNGHLITGDIGHGSDVLELVGE